MAEEPQPSTMVEGADPPDALPANAEDRKAAKAMSSLESNKPEEDAGPKKEVDLKALDDAISKLSAIGEPKKGNSEGKKKDEGPAKPLVKVDQADVALLVEQLDVSKAKATELLRQNEADAVKAMTAWVEAAV